MAAPTSRRLFVGGLPEDTTEHELDKKFKVFGKIVKIDMPAPKPGDKGMCVCPLFCGFSVQRVCVACLTCMLSYFCSLSNLPHDCFDVSLSPLPFLVFAARFVFLCQTIPVFQPCSQLAPTAHPLFPLSLCVELPPASCLLQYLRPIPLSWGFTNSYHSLLSFVLEFVFLVDPFASFFLVIVAPVLFSSRFSMFDAPSSHSSLSTSLFTSALACYLPLQFQVHAGASPMLSSKQILPVLSDV